MKIKNINDLYYQQKEIWNKENEHFFGISSLDNWNNQKIVKEHLDKCADKFWNNGTNELKKLFENGKCNNIDKLIPGSWELIFDDTAGLICLFASFKYEVDTMKNGESIKEEKIKRSPLAYLPYANDLCWFLNGTEYVLRVTASVNYSLITRVKNICKYQRTWTYDIDKDEFNILKEDFDPYDNLTKVNRIFLTSCLKGKKLTKDTFKEALKNIPEFNNKSIMYFNFEHISEMFKLVSQSNRFANPLMRVPVTINIVKMFSSKQRRDINSNDDKTSSLVLTTNKLFSLENSRTISYKSKYRYSFSFDDCDKIFDAFKTSTDKSAGRSRLLLDDIEVNENGILYKHGIDKNGNEIRENMFDLIIQDKIVVNNNLSVLSCSRFSSNNDAKRIMMTAKLRTQAISTAGEIDMFTHETPARIVFGDFEGFNYGDSIIISKSFAKKLESKSTVKKNFNKQSDYDYISNKYKIGDYITPNDWSLIVGSFMHDNFRNIHIDDLNRNSITVTARVPFSIGDKMTNLHGSKGIVCIILEDKDMPQLVNDISDNFKAGPFDVLVSGLSVYRRKSLGAIFEAWALATGHDDVNNIQDAVNRYYDDLVDYSNKCLVRFQGVECIKPCGINMIIRLNRDAVSMQSRSGLKSNYGKMLKFGEMELLNLAARNLTNVINELDIRSVCKHVDSFSDIKEAQKTGEIEIEVANNMRFFNLLRTIGFDFNLRNPKTIKSSDLSLKINNLLSDNKIDLFDKSDLED